MVIDACWAFIACAHMRCLDDLDRTACAINECLDSVAALTTATVVDSCAFPSPTSQCRSTSFAEVGEVDAGR